MNNKLQLSAFFISLYIQGLSGYFYLTGATGTRSTVLTAVFQAASLLLFLVVAYGIKDCRRKFQQVKVVDVLLLTFFIAVVLDLTVASRSYEVPPDVLPKFIVYMFALCVARCLTQAQFKLVFYTTTILAALTSILLCRDFLAGTAVAVNNASRLAIGDSANPIEAGNLGAYAAIMCLLLSVRAEQLPTKLLFLGLMAPGVLVSSLSGTRSAVITCAIGAVFLIGTSIIFKLRDIGSRLKQFSVSSLIYYLLIVVVLVGALTLPRSQSVAASGEKTDGFAIERTLSRLESITLIASGGADDSVGARYGFYDFAMREFNKNPLFGGKVYSSGFVHNAFLQVLAEFGIFGVVTYILPILWLCWRVISIAAVSLKQKSSYFKTDEWLVTAFTVILMVYAITVLMVHADPYRSYLPPCAIGMMIAFSRLGIDQKLKQAAR